MAQTLIFHYRDDDNFLVHFNPNAKLVALLSYSITVSSSDAYSVFILALLPVLLSFAIHIPWKVYLKECCFFIVLSAVMFLTSYISDNNITSSLSPAVAFLATVIGAMLLTDTTMPDDLSRSLGSALSHIAGRYAYHLASLMEITLSMIPLIIDSSLDIYEARRARGGRVFSHPLRFLSEYSVSVIMDLLDKAEVYIDALYSRGYDASRRRECAPYHAKDWIVISLSLVLVSLSFIRKWMV